MPEKKKCCGLSKVITDDTLTGDGTSSSPLHVVGSAPVSGGIVRSGNTLPDNSVGVDGDFWMLVDYTGSNKTLNGTWYKKVGGIYEFLIQYAVS